MFNQVTPQGDTVRRTVDVIQKLVVKKWRNTEEYEAFCYIASIVPTPEYYAKHKNVGREFRYGGDKGEFSGFVIYRTLAGKLVGIDNYERGRRTRHDYFPRITGENEDSIYSVARLSVPEMEVQAGTASAFSMNMEEDDPCGPYVADPVFCVTERPKHYCPNCGYEYCICGKDNWPDHPNPGGGTVTVPDYNDGGNQGYPGGGGGGGNGSNPNTGNTPSVATLFNAQGFTESQIAEINSILSKLSEIGISNKVLTKLMEKGKITLKTGTVSGHDNSVAIYNKTENSITINMQYPDANGVRNALIEETFHAYQYSVYEKPNQRCMEFEARIYGTIVVNHYEAPLPGFITYMNPFGPQTPSDICNNFANDLKSMTNGFTQNLSSGDMNTLYQGYGEYCTQYPAGDPNWEFKAIQNAQQ